MQIGTDRGWIKAGLAVLVAGSLGGGVMTVTGLPSRGSRKITADGVTGRALPPPPPRAGGQGGPGGGGKGGRRGGPPRGGCPTGRGRAPGPARSSRTAGPA